MTPPIIGLAGYARAGKDTAAEILGHIGYERRSFADALKALAVDIDPGVGFHGLGHVSLAWAVDRHGWETVKESSPDARRFLQRLGIAVRDRFGPETWVDLAFADLPDRTVVTDVRFPNEANRIARLGGEVWRIERPGVDPVNAHISETALDGYPFDAVIVNDGDLTSLRERLLALVPATT